MTINEPLTHQLRQQARQLLDKKRVDCVIGYEAGRRSGGSPGRHLRLRRSRPPDLRAGVRSQPDHLSAQQEKAPAARRRTAPGGHRRQTVR